MRKVIAEKAKKVEELADLFKQYKVIGLVGIQNIPARQMQQLRKLLRGQAVIKVSKRTLIKRALEKVNPELVKLLDYSQGPIGCILTNMNPFKLYNVLEANRTPAPLKPNQVAPNDIVIPAGDTGLPPGPFVGELQNLGVPARIERGKIVVDQDTVILRKGEQATKEIADALARLGIEPLEIGLDLHVAYEDGIFYTPDVLKIDVEKTKEEFATAHQYAINLAVNAPIFVPEAMKILLATCYQKAKNLAINVGIITKETINDILLKAQAEAISLATAANIIEAPKIEQPQEEKKEEAKEEKKEEEEEKKEEEALEGLGSLFGGV